jgi:hypothetical protein
MGERCNRTAEVRGSIPLGSTTHLRFLQQGVESKEFFGFIAPQIAPEINGASRPGWIGNAENKNTEDRS